MHATVIDTLRYADRLKEAGLEPRQAEAMSRALNDELTEGLVTKIDLDDAVTQLTSDLGSLGTRIDSLEGTVEAMESRFEAEFKAVDARFDAMDTKFDAMDTKFDAMDTKFDAMDTKFDAMDTKFNSLQSQSRYVFLVLALIAGLGLYNATAPMVAGVLGDPAPAEPDRAPAASNARPAAGV